MGEVFIDMSNEYFGEYQLCYNKIKPCQLHNQETLLCKAALDPGDSQCSISVSSLPWEQHPDM